MAYDQTQGRDEASWSQENDEYRRRASFAAAVVFESEAGQALRIASPPSGPGVYSQGWPSVVPTYAQPHGVYYPNSGYQQPLIPGHNPVGSSTYQGHSSARAGSHSTRVESSGYTTSQSYAHQYQYVHGTACPTTSYPTSQGYTTVEAVHMPLPPSSHTPSYQGPAYAYTAPAASVPASPPDVRYTIPLTQSLERGSSDAEYSVPCPYRCGTVLTGVHALGNLTRHLKTQACAGSSRAKVRYPCPIEGCGRQYARSDGLRVHMRRRHGAPPPVPRTDGVVDDDED